MFWTWNAVTHVILLQVALAFYVLIWPLLKSFAACAAREFARRYPSDTAAETASAGAKRPHRGKWRDTQYQRGERANKAERQEYRHRRTQAASGTIALKSKHHRELGLSEPVPHLHIKKAYRQMARDFHPDKFVSEQYSDDKRAAAARQMREVNAAYDWLRSNT